MLRKLASIFLCVCILITSIVFVQATPMQNLHIEYKEYEKNVQNLGKGLAYTSYSSNPGDALSEKALDIVSTIYTRTHWSRHNPAEDVYDWTYYDELLDWCEKNDKYLAFGIMNLDVMAGSATPMWVFEEAGAKGLEVICGYGYTNAGPVPGQEYHGSAKTWVPDYKDPIFWEKHDKFVKAMAERYDGHPRVAYVAMLSDGTYGEGGYGRMYSPDEPLPTYPSAEETWDIFYGAYQKYFTKTPLMYEKTTGFAEAADKGVGVKRNSLMGPMEQSQILARATKNGSVPVHHEFYGKYADQKAAANIGNAWYGEDYMWYMQEAHSTYACTSLDPGDGFIDAEYDVLKLTNDKVGYRWTINSMDIPAQFAEGETADICINIENNGLARCHRGGAVRLALLDENDEVVAQQWIDGVDPKTWIEHNSYDVSMPVEFSNINDGKYRLAIGVNHYLGSDEMYNLANYDKTSNGFYVLADVENKNKVFTISRHESDETITLCAGNTELELGTVKTKNGKFFVPIRKICEGLGVDLVYDAASNSVTLIKNDKEYNIVFGTNLASGIDCKNVHMTNKLETIDGVGYICTDELTALFGTGVSFDSEKRNLIISLEDTDFINTKPYMNRYELVEDSGFELNSDAWSLDATAFSVSDEQAAEGAKALKMTNTAPYTEFNRKKAIQLFTVESEKLYKLTFKTKGDAKVRCKVYGNWDESIAACASEPSEDWVENTLFFNFRDTFFRRDRDPFAYVSFETTGQNNATAYIDDVMLYTDADANLAEKNKDGIEIYGNGGFENDGKGWTDRSNVIEDYIEDDPHSGVGYASIDMKSPVWSSLCENFTTKMVKAGPGVYKYTCWLKADKPDTVVTVVPITIRDTETVHNSPIDFSVKVGTQWQKIEREFVIDWENSSPELDARNREMTIFGGIACVTQSDSKVYMDDISLKKIGELPQESDEPNLFARYEATADYGFETIDFDRYKSGPRLNWKVDDGFGFKVAENGYEGNGLSFNVKPSGEETCIADAYWYDTLDNNKVFGLENGQRYRLSFWMKLNNGMKANANCDDLLQIRDGILKFDTDEPFDFANDIGGSWRKISIECTATLQPDNNSDNGGTGSYFSIWTKPYSEYKDNVYILDNFSLEKVE